MLLMGIYGAQFLIHRPHQGLPSLSWDLANKETTIDGKKLSAHVADQKKQGGF